MLDVNDSEAVFHNKTNNGFNSSTGYTIGPNRQDCRALQVIFEFVSKNELQISQ
jgi:hypothetical protein